MPDEIITRNGDRIKTVPLEWLPLEFLLFSLSPVDRTDLFGQSPTENVLMIAHAIINAEKGLGWIIVINGRPAGALGVYELHRGNWEIWSFGIERPDVALLILGQIFERAIPHIKSHGGWRIQCRTRFDHTSNRTHLRLLGFRVEAVLRHYGTDKSHYLQFVYLLDEKEEGEPIETEPAIAAPDVLPSAPAALIL